MITGGTHTIRVQRQNAAGTVASSGLLSTAFLCYLDGVSQTLSSFSEVGTVGTWTEYKWTIPVSSTAGQHLVRTYAASGSDVILNDAIYYDVETYDSTTLASLLLTNQGVPSVTSAIDNSLGDIVDGDSYLSSTLTMPAGKLSPFSISDISAVGITVEAAIMGTPGGTSYPITATVVSGPSLTFTIGWNTQQHPALTTSPSAVWYIDVQVIKTGPPKIIVTTNRYTFAQVWQRDTRTT